MDGGSFDVYMRASSPAIFNGGTGVYPLCGLRSHQYSLPVLATKGTVMMGEETYDCSANYVVVKNSP
jgi:predicted secreted hydrolase